MASRETLQWTTIQPGHPEYDSKCHPDLRYPKFSDVDFGAVAGLGVVHLLIDVDGVLVAGHRLPEGPDESTKAKLAELLDDTRFLSVNLATENGNPPDRIRESLGLPERVDVFEPFTSGDIWHNKFSPDFWRLVYSVLHCKPGLIGMIGDSPSRDIMPAQTAGLKTVQVDRLEVVESSYARLIADPRKRLDS
jgi:predicted HAD superfamily phosphohydrolase YqeG